MLSGFYLLGKNGEGAQRPTPFCSRWIKESGAVALPFGAILLSFISIVDILLKTEGQDPGGSIVKGDEAPRN